MPTIECNGGPLDYEVIDITPTWVSDPETVLSATASRPTGIFGPAGCPV